jgi:hypothetical protein
MPLVNHLCHHSLIKKSCSQCGREFLFCDICHPGQDLCDPCKPLLIDYPSRLSKTYRGIAYQERKTSIALKRLSRVRKNINKERGIHITPAGARYTREQMQKRREYAARYSKEHAEEIRQKAHNRYYSDLESSRAYVLEKYYRNPRNPVTRKNWFNRKREEIKAYRRAYYARNREHILAHQKNRRSDPLIREHRNQLAKLNRLRKSKH